MKAPGAPKPVETSQPLVTDTKGIISIDNLNPGIYFIRKVASSRPQLMEDEGGLFAIPSLDAEKPYDIEIKYSKYTYHTPEKTAIPVEKAWLDDDNFDEIRPTSITAVLTRSLNGT